MQLSNPRDRQKSPLDTNIGSTTSDDWLGNRIRVSDDGKSRLQLKIGNLHCSFCVSTIEKAVGRLDGVDDVSISLAHEEGLITYRQKEIEPQAIVDTLRSVGYSVRDPRKIGLFEEQQAEVLAERDRFQVGLVLTVITLLPMSFDWVSGHPPSINWHGHLFVYGPWIILGIALSMIFIVGKPILTIATASLRRNIMNQHVLLEFGAFSGLAGGIVGLLIAPKVFPAGDFLSVAIFITTYHLLSGYVSSLVRSDASASVRQLLELQPETARVIRSGNEFDIPVTEVILGELVRIRPGERIPLDGKVLSGISAIDESMISGEPIPVTKAPGSEVIGGSLNTMGSLVIEVSKIGDDTFLAQIAYHIEEARSLKPNIIILVDKILKVFVPTVLAFAAISLIVWTVGSWTITGHLYLSRGIFATLAVLVMGYPCALGMSTPLAMMRGGARAAELGIVMRSGEAFQIFSDIDTAVFDKTGTITLGKPTVGEIIVSDKTDEDELLAKAAAVEIASEHPLGSAIVAAADKKGLHIIDADDFKSITGQGVSATVSGETYFVGKPSWIVDMGIDMEAFVEQIEKMRSKAITVVAVTKAHKAIGLIGIADGIKPDAKDTIFKLKKAGITPLMVTGDHLSTALVIGAQVGIDQIQAGMLPEQKATIIRELQTLGHKVMMVGDGINDAPALAQADIGIAMGGGTDIAIESADVVLIGNRLGAVVDVREIGGRSFSKTKQNLLISFGFNGVGVPLAITGYLQPTWAMIAMIASVSLVLANSFAARLDTWFVREIGRFMGDSFWSFLRKFKFSELRKWLFSSHTYLVVVIIVLSLIVGTLSNNH